MFSESTDNFLAKVIEELTRGDVLLDLILTNGEELGCSDHETVELGQNHRITTLDLVRADLNLFRGLRDQLGRIPQDITLKRSPGELFDFQGSLPKSLSPSWQQEVKQERQEARVNEQAAFDQTQIWKGSVQKVGPGAGDPGRIQSYCLNVQWGSGEIQVVQPHLDPREDGEANNSWWTGWPLASKTFEIPHPPGFRMDFTWYHLGRFCNL